MSPSERVVIGMDPHKRSATIEVMSIRGDKDSVPRNSNERTFKVTLGDG